MKITMNRILILAIIFHVAVLNSFSQLNIGVEYRPRFEFRDGYRILPPALGQSPAFQVSQRTRLNVGFKWSIINTYLSVQDVRIWGDEPLKKDMPAMNLYQGWVEIKIADSLFVKAGRQEFIYDNERLLSNTNWQQKALTHDAVLLRFNHKGLSASLAGAFNQSRDTTFGTDYNTALGNYKTLNFLWLGYRIQHFGVQLAGIADGYQKKGTTSTLYIRGTTGGIISFFNRMMNIDGRGFYQFGRDESGTEISAWYANADFTFRTATFLNIATGFELMSGTNMADTLNRKNRAFSTLYGTGHKFNGNMDYFTKPADTRNCGLLDIYLNFIFLLKQKYQLRADLHYFRLENSYTSGGETMNSNLGVEADFSTRIPIVRDVDLQLGYSFLFGTPTLEQIQGGNRKNFGQWAFVMLNVKPTVFTHSNKSKD